MQNDVILSRPSDRALCAALVAGCLGALPAAAQSYPTKPIRIIVPFAAGGPNDILARVVGKNLSENLGQQVIANVRRIERLDRAWQRAGVTQLDADVRHPRQRDDPVALGPLGAAERHAGAAGGEDVGEPLPEAATVDDHDPPSR